LDQEEELAVQSNRRVLVVEDEALVAMLIDGMLSDMGFAVVGPTARLEPALAIARSEPLDAAVLDVNLAGEQSFPIADVLRDRQIPFIFATGYGTSGIADRFRGVIVLQKPFQEYHLRQAISTILPAA